MIYERKLVIFDHVLIRLIVFDILTAARAVPGHGVIAFYKLFRQVCAINWAMNPIARGGSCKLMICRVTR